MPALGCESVLGSYHVLAQQVADDASVEAASSPLPHDASLDPAPQDRSDVSIPEDRNADERPSDDVGARVDAGLDAGPNLPSEAHVLDAPPCPVDASEEVLAHDSAPDCGELDGTREENEAGNEAAQPDGPDDAGAEASDAEAADGPFERRCVRRGGHVWSGGRGRSCLWLISGPMSWVGARQACQDFDADRNDKEHPWRVPHLAVLPTQAEALFARAHVLTEDAWLGAYGWRGQLSWIQEELDGGTTFWDWGDNEPRTYAENLTVGHSMQKRGWETVPESWLRQQAALCEQEAEPLPPQP